MSDGLNLSSQNSGEWTEVILSDEIDHAGYGQQTVLQKSGNGSIHIGQRYLRPGSDRWIWHPENWIDLDREGAAKLKEGLR